MKAQFQANELRDPASLRTSPLDFDGAAAAAAAFFFAELIVGDTVEPRAVVCVHSVTFLLSES